MPQFPCLEKERILKPASPLHEVVVGKEMVPFLQVLDTGLGMQQALHTRGLLLVTGVCLPICLCCGDMKAEDCHLCSREHPNALPASIAQSILRPHPRPALDSACIRSLLSPSQDGLTTVGFSSSRDLQAAPPSQAATPPSGYCVSLAVPV